MYPKTRPDVNARLGPSACVASTRSRPTQRRPTGSRSAFPRTSVGGLAAAETVSKACPVNGETGFGTLGRILWTGHSQIKPSGGLPGGRVPNGERFFGCLRPAHREEQALYRKPICPILGGHGPLVGRREGCYTRSGLAGLQKSICSTNHGVLDDCFHIPLATSSASHLLMRVFPSAERAG
jgi:hypothetical protein